MIVTAKYLNAALQELVGEAIQRIPVDIEASDEPYEILNVLDTIECVREWNPATGQKRTWHEVLDHSGNARHWRLDGLLQPRQTARQSGENDTRSGLS